VKKLMLKSFGPAAWAGILLAVTLTPAGSAAADCRLAQVQFTPEAGMQIAVWLEDSAGNFVDTLYITRLTGSYGLGNRPGRSDLNTNYLWPYGRRENVLPVWAHHRGVTYPKIEFRNGRDSDLSHPANQSSVEPFFCEPMSFDQNPPDATTCATPYTGTDKGKPNPNLTSYYPPRNDITTLTPTFDDPGVASYAEMNDLDAVSRATPPGGQPFQVLTALAPTLPDGDYFIMVEVSHELDYNDTYNPNSFPPPAGISFGTYGDPYRGQPSLVWKVPITLAAGEGPKSFSTLAYAGYGDPDGLNGDINPPDATIDPVAGFYTFDQDGTAGSRPPHNYPSFGEARLQLTSGADGMYKVRVAISPSNDVDAPGAAADLAVDTIEGSLATMHFVSPGDDGMAGTATEYEIRYSVGTPMSSDTFESGTRVADGLTPVEAGSTVTFQIPSLLPKTHYWVGVRAKDECLTAGQPTIIDFTTEAAEGGEVDACFVATAAWGSLMQAQVGSLRHFRDRVLRASVLGELFVETYYTFGPALAEVIEPSATLRQMARSGLSSLVTAAEDAVK
jgi:hypothetical protein